MFTGKKCRPPPNISNGKYECGDLYYETVCNLKCDQGYNSEIGFIQCQSDGAWANVNKAICKGIVAVLFQIMTPLF